MKKILIAVPHTGNIRAELTQALLLLSHKADIWLSWGRPITENRKQICANFLAGDWDYLLQIDSDIEPPVNILDMVEHGVDICSGNIAIVKGITAFRLALVHAPNGEYMVKPDLQPGLNEVDATGAGCLLLSRAAAAVGFADAPSEDFDFCARAKQAGFTIHFDMDMVCKHYQIVPIY